MEILSRIKTILGIKDKKLLEAPISALTIEQKDILAIQLLKQAKKSGQISPKIFQLIESFGEEYKQQMGLRVLHFAQQFGDEIHKQIEQKLSLSYDNKDELKRKTFLNAINYADYKDKQLEKLLPYLNKVEIQAFIESRLFRTWGLTNEKQRKIYKILLDNGIDIGRERLEIYYDNDPNQISKVIQTYPIDKQIEEWKKCFEDIFHLEDYINIYNEYLTTLNPIERVLLKLNIYQIFYYGKKEDLEKLSIEELKELIEKNNEKIPKIAFENYLRQKYSLEELQELESNYSNDLIEKLGIQESIIQKQADKDVEEYYNLETATEKDEYFMNLSMETLNRKIAVFSESIERIPKEILKQKLEQMQDIITIFHKIQQKFSTEEIYNLLKSGEIKYTTYEINKLINELEPNQIKQLIFNEKYDSKDVNILVSKVFEKIRQTKEESIRIELKKLLYETLEKFGDDIRTKKLEGMLDVEEVQEIIQKYPKTAEFINYKEFSLQEMESLSESCKDVEQYNLNIISRYSRKGEIKPEEQQLLRNLKIKSYCNLINSGKIKFVNNYDDILRDINNIKEIFDNLKDEEAKINFIDNDNINCVIFDMKQEEYFLTQADKTGQLLKLYKTINSENISKLENVREDEKDGNYARIRFKWNLKTIYENREKLIALTEKNPTTILTINYSILKVFEDTNLEFFSKYHSLNMIHFNESETSIEFLKKIVGEISTKIQYPEEIITNCMRCSSDLYDETMKQLLEKEPIDKIIYLMNSNPELFQKSMKTYEIIRDFEEAEQEYCDNKVRNPESNLQDILDAYMRRFFNLTYDQASKNVRQYKSGLKELIKRYETKHNLSIQEQQELSSLKQLLYIKEILNIKDIDILRQSYEDFVTDPNITKPTYMESLITSEMVKSAYSKEKIENLFVPQPEKQDERISFNGSEINVYKLKDNWNMLVTVVGAYNKNKKAAQNPKEEWNAPDKIVNHGICTSLIGNNNMSMAYRKDNLIYGFYRLSPDSIKSEASYDLATYSNDIQITQARENQFRTTEDLKTNVRRGHSEILIERRPEGDKTEKRQPDYIIAINKIRECDKKAASEFGIPIVFINIKEIAELESQKIKELQQKLDEELSIENLSQLVNQYHSNYAGLTTVDKKSCRKYFNPQKTGKYFEKIADDISRIQDSQQKSQLAQEYRRLLLEEENKRMYVEKKYIPFKFDEIIKKLDEMIIDVKPKTGLDYIKVNVGQVVVAEQNNEKSDVEVTTKRGGRDE